MKTDAEIWWEAYLVIYPVVASIETATKRADMTLVEYKKRYRTEAKS